MGQQSYFLCPRIGCVNHHLEAGRSDHWYYPSGTYHTLAFGVVQRYRCRDCGKNFSDQTFSLNYYLKKKTDFRTFAREFNSRASDLFCARPFGYSSASVQTRVDRLARNAIFMHTRLRETLRLSEHLVADGLESYTGSKYFPNNINILIGKDSEYLYEFNLSHTKRKGRVNEVQRARMDRIYEGKSFVANEMHIRFTELLSTAAVLMENRRIDEVILHTDENPVYAQAYSPAYAHAVKHKAIEKLYHHTTSSTEPRVKSNPLFAVNYFDRLIRKDMVNHRRKSICFARDAQNMMSRFAWYVCAHNYFKPKRISSKGAQEEGRHHSGVECDRGELKRWKKMIYEKRYLLSLSTVGGYQRKVWTKSVASPLGERGRWNYLPKFAIA